MDNRLYPQGRGGLKGRYTAGVLFFYNSTGQRVYGIDPTNRRFVSGENNADNAGNTLRFNSITNFGTADSFTGVQIKPGQGATSTKTLMGLEVSPRVNSGVELANIIGAHTTAYLRGTAAGTISGDVRGLQIEVVTDDAGTRTIGGNVSMLRFRAAFSATTISGKFVPIRIEKPEVQTNSKNFDAVLELTSNLAGVWKDSPGTEPTTADGYFKVLVNGNARYVQLYSVAPVD
jgi:hypothetical protein